MTGGHSTGPATVNDWVNVVRRARLHATTKLIALLLASYADKHGANIYPGVARLAIQSGHGYRTVQRELARLRAVGLITQIPRTGQRRGWATVYQLTLPDNLLERDDLDVPLPAAEDAAVEKLTAQYRGRHRATARNKDGVQTSPGNENTARQDDGVQTHDCTPYEDTTARHGQLGKQAKRHRTHHVPLPMEANPPSDEANLRYARTGGSPFAAATESTHRNGGTGSRTARQSGDGFEDQRREALDRLEAWIREQEDQAQ